MSKNSMKNDKMCFELALESGNGNLMIDVAMSSDVRTRLYQSDGLIHHLSIAYKSQTGDWIVVKNKEPIMICFDKSDASNLKIEAIKGELKRTLIFSCSSATAQSEWRIHLQNDSGSSNIELRLSKRKITNMIPTGFSPWLDAFNTNKRDSCRSRKSSFDKIPLMYIFVSLSYEIVLVKSKYKL